MISDALRLIRVFHDLKQKELSDKLEISKSYLSEIESGKKKPSLDLIDKYAEIFSIPSSSIMFFSENIGTKNTYSDDERVRSVIAGKIIQFLNFIESKTDDGKKGL